MQKFDTINVVPFIDIMLVLLAIVLTIATFVNSGRLEISLPKAVSDSHGDQRKSTEIAIDKNQNLFLNGDVVSLVELETLLATKPKNLAIHLRVDESVPFSQFVTVIDLLKVNNLDNVSVLTQKSSNINTGLISDKEIGQ